MTNRELAVQEIFNRIRDSRLETGVKTFSETPTEKGKVEEIPICNMLYGVDQIEKRSSRTASPSRSGVGDRRSVEVILEIIAFKKDGGSFELYKKIRNKVLADIYPVKVNGVPDGTTYMQEERTEGPVGYGLSGVDAMIFVIKVFYNDEF